MNKKTASIYMLCLLSIFMIFHVLIITEYIPFDKVWAGRLTSVEEMRTYETFSIILNLFMIIIISIKYRLLLIPKSNSIINFFIWAFFIFFGLNSIGNLFSKNIYELILGTLFTLLSSFLCYTLVKKEPEN